MNAPANPIQCAYCGGINGHAMWCEAPVPVPVLEQIESNGKLIAYRAGQTIERERCALRLEMLAGEIDRRQPSAVQEEIGSKLWNRGARSGLKWSSARLRELAIALRKGE